MRLLVSGIAIRHEGLVRFGGWLSGWVFLVFPTVVLGNVTEFLANRSGIVPHTGLLSEGVVQTIASPMPVCAPC